MKKSILTFLFFSLFFSSIFAQVPELMNYQAVARDNGGELIKISSISLRLSILKGSANGQVIYKEQHTKTTNDFGAIDLRIGSGNNQQGSLSNISWGTSDHFLKVEMDVNGGSNFKTMGSTQLVTVPYAFFANNGVQFNQDIECSPETEGMLRYNTDQKIMEYCNGEDWVTMSGSSSSGFNCGEFLIDARDGQSYSTVLIGGKCWMAQNLNYGVYKESVFTNAEHSDVSNNGVVEKYAFDNDESNFALYGGLYDWNELMNYQNVEGSQGICPNGWHVPSDAEMDELIDAVGGNQNGGTALLVGGSSGFEFPIGGSRTAKGGFSTLGTAAIWASTTSLSHPDSRAYNIYFTSGASNVSSSTGVMVVGKACRCVKN